jgi:hypothetical protein
VVIPDLSSIEIYTKKDELSTNLQPILFIAIMTRGTIMPNGRRPTDAHILACAFHKATEVLGKPAASKVVSSLKNYGVYLDDPNFDLQKLSTALNDMLGTGAASLIFERLYLALDELATKPSGLGRLEVPRSLSGAEVAFLTGLWGLTFLFALLVSIGATTFTLGLTIDDHPADLLAYAAISWVPLVLLVFTLVTWRPWKRTRSEVRDDEKRQMEPVIAKILNAS